MLITICKNILIITGTVYATIVMIGIVKELFYN